jgi:hypothetical protein
MMMIERTTAPIRDRVTVRTVPLLRCASITEAPVDGATVARQSSSRNPTWIVTW